MTKKKEKYDWRNFYCSKCGLETYFNVSNLDPFPCENCKKGMMVHRAQVRA